MNTILEKLGVKSAWDKGRVARILVTLCLLFVCVGGILLLVRLFTAIHPAYPKAHWSDLLLEFFVFTFRMITLALIPDCKGYHGRYQRHILNQTEWLARKAKARDIRLAIHLGNVTRENTSQQWAFARLAFRKLDGILPYALALGERDYGRGGKTDSPG